MHLETLNIHGFGCLRTSVDFAPDRLNLTIADNEAGKSTLIAALLAAFYGIVEDYRVIRDKRPHIRNILPWTDPEEFGLELEFTINRTPWRIERDFHAGSVKLVNRKTGREHQEKYHKGRARYRIGEELLGLTCDDFLKSFYLRQEEIHDILDAGGLTTHVQRVATARDGEVTSEAAVERLRATLNRYPVNGATLKVETAIKRFEDELEGILQALAELDRTRRDILPDTQRLEQLERDIERLRRERDRDQRLGDLAEMQELRRQLEQQEELAGKVAELEAQATELEPFASFPADRWDQLITYMARVEQLTRDIQEREKARREKGEKPLEEVEKKLQEHQRLVQVTADDVKDFESAFSRLSDRDERRCQAAARVEQLEGELAGKGFGPERFQRLQQAFSGLTADQTRFIGEFRATYAEEEGNYREIKARREWLERERDLTRDRRRRTMNSARLFFIMAAVMLIAGGLMMLLTAGGWIGSILAGLGAVFGAVGFIIRGTAGSYGSSGLQKLDIDLEVAVEEEEEARGRLDAVASQLNDLAAAAGFGDGNQLLAEYAEFGRLEKLSEPLLDTRRDLERAAEEAGEALRELQPFFEKAGEEPPELEDARKEARKLLDRFREVARLTEEYRSLKGRLEQYDEDLERLGRDLENQRGLAEDIIRLGGVEPTDPLDNAITAFRERRDKHQQYRVLVDDELPRLKRDLLPEVDLTAKRERLDMLASQRRDEAGDAAIEHSKEFYRDRADRAAREIETLGEERLDINRRIGTALDRVQKEYPEQQRSQAEVEEELAKARGFKSEVETAIRILEEISREVYRDWAEALSKTAAPFLKALNPRYTALNFEDDLSFTIVDSLYDRRISSREVETILSSGARDEVFLAARLGISSYLARGVKGALPIVLDEPLAAVDDEKFVSGMTFFLDVLSRQHQVLIMSCHAERHRWLAEQMPDLFNERVHQIELRSEAAVDSKKEGAK